jgi:hypothetical protein
MTTATTALRAQPGSPAGRVALSRDRGVRLAAAAACRSAGSSSPTSAPCSSSCSTRSGRGRVHRAGRAVLAGRSRAFQELFRTTSTGRGDPTIVSPSRSRSPMRPGAADRLLHGRGSHHPRPRPPRRRVLMPLWGVLPRQGLRVADHPPGGRPRGLGPGLVRRPGPVSTSSSTAGSC